MSSTEEVDGVVEEVVCVDLAESVATTDGSCVVELREKNNALVMPPARAATIKRRVVFTVFVIQQRIIGLIVSFF